MFKDFTVSLKGSNEPLKKRRWTQLGNHHFQLISSFLSVWLVDVSGCEGFFLCVSCFFGAIILRFFEIHEFLEVLLKSGAQVSRHSLNCPSLEVEPITNDASSEPGTSSPICFCHNRPLHPKDAKKRSIREIERNIDISEHDVFFWKKNASPTSKYGQSYVWGIHFSHVRFPETSQTSIRIST